MNAKTMTLIGAILILVSLFLPAVTISAGFLSKSINGYETDLIFAGLPGFVLLIVGLAGKMTPDKHFSLAGAFFAILSLLVCGIVFLNVSSVGTSDVDAAMGAALPLCALVLCQA
jgi:multidrug transporter EmrE-like cation transporter